MTADPIAPTTAWGVIAETVENTAMSHAEIEDRYGVAPDDIDHELAAQGTELCPGCGWWWPSLELDPEGSCPDCREDHDDE